MSNVTKGKAVGAGPARKPVDFSDALSDVGDFTNTRPATPKVDPQATRRGSESAGFSSRPVVKETAVSGGVSNAQFEDKAATTKVSARSRTRTKRKPENERIAIRADPKMFDLLKDLGADQDPPWPVGYAFGQAVLALQEKIEANS